MKILGKSDILSAEDLEREIVEVEEWGGSVIVRGLTGSERDKFESSIAIRKGRKVEINTLDVRAKLLSLTIIDEDGERIFTDAEVSQLGKKSASALDKLFAVAQRLSGLSDGDVEELADSFE